MRTVKRKARVGERIVITDPKKGWNGHDDKAKGMVMTVTKAFSKGVYTEEFYAIWINHDGYEVLEGEDEE